jgi:hypothetical protein
MEKSAPLKIAVSNHLSATGKNASCFQDFVARRHLMNSSVALILASGTSPLSLRSFPLSTRWRGVA